MAMMDREREVGQFIENRPWISSRAAAISPEGSGRRRWSGTGRSTGPSHTDLGSARTQPLFRPKDPNGGDGTGPGGRPNHRTMTLVPCARGHIFRPKDPDRADGAGPGGRPGPKSAPTLVPRARGRVFRPRDPDGDDGAGPGGRPEPKSAPTLVPRAQARDFARGIRTEAMEWNREVDRTIAQRPRFRARAAAFFDRTIAHDLGSARARPHFSPEGSGRGRWSGTGRSTGPKSAATLVPRARGRDLTRGIRTATMERDRGGRPNQKAHRPWFRTRTATRARARAPRPAPVRAHRDPRPCATGMHARTRPCARPVHRARHCRDTHPPGAPSPALTGRAHTCARARARCPEPGATGTRKPPRPCARQVPHARRCRYPCKPAPVRVSWDSSPAVPDTPTPTPLRAPVDSSTAVPGPTHARAMTRARALG